MQAQRDEELSKFNVKLTEYENKLTASNQTKLLLTEQVFAVRAIKLLNL